ncbi:FAD-dependent oxidoreductase [Tenacibaculum sp. Bg11-29]|uniref:NAD(P)/FAD-dependent oxidoreductase n=1 Tax=Tenacibaculum sp. Bg11-29 TaxID=2058306 RepID=UPI000C32252D|nr:FAD-dependent oxidoreductase [Tenacibaculum sp. Bg11-29]PKH50626.1 FAD-dependent oxidoreductase [Tenacibaculum sp. Bg11-29]
MKTNVDYIIVGLGLAGIAFAEELLNAKKSFVIFENNSQTSSIVAGGVYNPVILKRFNAVWNAHQQIVTSEPFYKSLEKKLNVKLDYKFSIKKAFSSVGDENNWFLALDKPTLSHYMNPVVSKEKIDGVIGELGFGELTGTGRIDTALLVRSYREYIDKSGILISETFNYTELNITDDGVNYKNINASKIVFSEGFGITENPFFNHLPLNEAKGETITIHAPDLNIDFLLKSSAFVMPLGNDLYKVGATFNWTDKTCNPTEEARKELEDKLKKVITVPYTVTDHTAGIRPTVNDRRPMVGIHPDHKALIVLNGLGTRGVMIGPTIAKNLFNHLENGEELDKEIDIKRFDA